MESTEDPSGDPVIPETTTSAAYPACGHEHGWFEDPLTGIVNQF